MGKFTRRVAGLVVIGAASVYAYENLLDKDTKETLQKTFSSVYETCRAVADRLVAEIGQIMEENPDLASVKEELQEKWANLGY